MLATPSEMTEGVASALRNGLYGSKEEFEKLPPDIQRIVGSSNMLREWAMMDTETVQSVVASNFQRDYLVRAKRKAEIEALPSDIKQIVGSLSNQFSLEDGSSKQ